MSDVVSEAVAELGIITADPNDMPEWWEEPYLPWEDWED